MRQETRAAWGLAGYLALRFAPIVVALLALLLAGCNAAGDRAAEAHAAAIWRSDKCRLATVAAEEYLIAGNDRKYREWSTTRELDCMGAI